MIIQGSTAPIVLSFADNMESVTDLKISIYRSGYSMLKSWNLSDVTIVGKTVTCPLSQVETLALPTGFINIEAKWLDSNGLTRFGQIAKDEVIGRRDHRLLTGTITGSADEEAITIESLDGVLKGEKGDKGDKGDTGDEGYSPSAKVERVTSGAKITITDKTGTTQAVVNDGQNATAVDNVFPVSFTVEAIAGRGLVVTNVSKTADEIYQALKAGKMVFGMNGNSMLRFCGATANQAGQLVTLKFEGLELLDNSISSNVIEYTVSKVWVFKSESRGILKTYSLSNGDTEAPYDDIWNAQIVNYNYLFYYHFGCFYDDNDNEVNLFASILENSIKLIKMTTEDYEACSVEYSEISLNIPTKTSDLTNDSGYITTANYDAIADIVITKLPMAESEVY